MAILRGNNMIATDPNQMPIALNKIDIGRCIRKSLTHITNTGIDKIATLIILILVS